MPQVTTQQIGQYLNEIAAGNKACLAELLGHVGDRLRIVASRALYNSRAGQAHALSDTEDVLQSAYLRILSRCDYVIQRIGQVAETDRVRYFFGCTSQTIRDLVVEELRRPASRRALHQPPFGDHSDDSMGMRMAENAASESESPDKLAMWSEFHSFIESLPEGVRDVVDLHWYHGLTHNEVGIALGIAEVTSRARWAQARHRAIEKFSESPFEQAQP